MPFDHLRCPHEERLLTLRWLEEGILAAISTHMYLQEACVQAAEKAFARARAVDRGRQRLSQLARMHAHMCQGLGQHHRAAAILTEALGSDLSADATVECLHLRGAPYTSLCP